MDSRINKENTKRILQWCIDKLGKSRFHRDKPKLIIHTKIRKCDKGTYGEYSNTNVIHIYLPNQDNIHSFIDTVIHEFWHYKQNPKGYIRVYSRMDKFTDETLPYEISARNKAKKYRWLCYEELFKNQN